MSNIKDIVEQVRETPSLRCWDSIASQLPAAGATAGASAAATGKAAAAATKSALSLGKLAAIIGGVAAITAGAITTISILKNEPATTTPTANNNSMAILTDTAAIDADTLILEEPITTTENKNIAQNRQKTDENTIPSHNNITPGTTNTTNSTTTTITSPIVPTPATANNSMPTAQNITPTTHPVPSTSNTTHPTPQATPKAQTSTQPADNDKNDDEFNDFAYEKPIKIEIPNIFTPNGDGVNDLFVIKGIENCQKSHLIVKDHSGNTVLQSQHYDNSWDGNNLPDGTYFYQFAYTINNINEVRRGQLMIRR